MAQLESGETGRVADPSTMPRPALWPDVPAGQQPAPLSGRVEPGEAEEEARDRLPLAWVGVGLMIVGLISFGLGIAVQHWLPLVAGVVVGLVGAAFALKARIMDSATVSEDVGG